jgi:hypothetical protein
MRVILYEYGPLAWVWRALILVAVAAGVFSIWNGVRLDSLSLGFSGAAVLVPALYFGTVLAAQLEREDDSVLRVHTLFFWTRRIALKRLGSVRYRQTAEGDAGSFYAPRVWIPVRSALPIYIDLLGRIADRRAFASLFGLSASQLPNASRAP